MKTDINPDYEGDEAPPIIMWVVVILSCLVIDACGVAFLYKVWNERQMTHEYHEQAVQTKRVADAFEFFAEERRAGKP